MNSMSGGKKHSGERQEGTGREGIWGGLEPRGKGGAGSQA